MDDIINRLDDALEDRRYFRESERKFIKHKDYSLLCEFIAQQTGVESFEFDFTKNNFDLDFDKAINSDIFVITLEDGTEKNIKRFDFNEFLLSKRKE